MTIELRPEEQRIVNDAVRSGEYQKAEDVISDALHAWQQRRCLEGSQKEGPTRPRAKDLVELFAPLRGLNLNFGRTQSNGRPIDL